MKWKPLNCPLVAGYSIGHKSSPLHVSRWDCRKTHQVYVNSFFCWQRFLFFKVVLMTLIFVKVFIFMASLISHLMLDASPSESISQWSVPGVCFCGGKPWVSAFTWKSSAIHHQAEYCCRSSTGPPLAKVIPAGSDPHSRKIQKVLPHCRNCSGVAQRSWQVAQGVDLASRFPKP